MSSTRWTAAALFFGIAIGYALQNGSLEPVAAAQSGAAAGQNAAGPADQMASGRFQISTGGFPGGLGCYLVDTATGELWIVRESKSPDHIGKPRFRSP